MRILTVTATEFGLFKNKHFSFDKELSLITGANESGKSTLQALIIFLLYGFPPRDQTERALRLSRDGKRAAGEMTFTLREGTYRIRRTYLLRSLSGRSAPLEECEVTDAAGQRVDLGGKQPGEYFLGIPREIYEATALSKQSEIDTVTDASTGDAISNLLFLDAGGAGLDTALRLLDTARRELVHNRGQGGLLHTLKDERAAIEGDLHESKARVTRLHELRARISQLTVDLQDKERALSALEAQTRAGELEALLNRFAALHQAEAEEARLHTALHAGKEKARQAPRITPDTLTALQQTISQQAALAQEHDALLARADEAAATHKHITEGKLYKKIESFGGVKRLDTSVTRLQKRQNRLTLLLAVLFTLGVGLLALSFVLPTHQPLLFAASGCLLLAAAAALGGKLHTRHQLFAICKAVELQSPQLIPTLLATHLAANHSAESCLQARESHLANAALLAEKMAETTQTLAATATTLGLPADTAAEALLQHALALAAAENQENAATVTLQTALAAAHARRETLAAELGALDEAALRAEQRALGEDISPLTADESLRHRTFLTEAKAGLSAKLLDAAREEAAIAAKENDVSALEAALAENKLRAQSATERLAAIKLAESVLEEANDALHQDLLPRIVNEASRILAALTDGQYQTLCLTSDFSVSLEADNGTYPLSSFSAGCRDAVGLALRLALTRVITKEPLPLLLDEVTARLDDTRADSLLSILSRLAGEGAQILLFTCHTREATMLQAAGAAYTGISLSAESSCRA